MARPTSPERSCSRSQTDRGGGNRGCGKVRVGASRPLPRVPANMPLLNRQRTLSLGGGNRSWCPIRDLPGGLGADRVGWTPDVRRDHLLNGQPDNQTRERGTIAAWRDGIQGRAFSCVLMETVWQFYKKGRPKPPLETGAPITSGKSSRPPRCPGSARGGHWRRRQNVYRSRCPAPRRNPRHRRTHPGRTGYSSVG
jgi:hypothetical protein